MISPRHERSRAHFLEHEEVIANGVRLLAEGWVIEVAEEVASMLPARVLDSVARSRVKAKLAPRVEEAVAWARKLGKEI